MKIVSACLAGIKCRYDGTAKPNKKVIDLIKKGKAIPICPEQLGGLSTPRIPAETIGKKVINKKGRDVTSYFVKGAKEALKIAKMARCKEAILKSKSPSCGVNQIYDGSFSGKLKKGDGVFTKLLKRNKIKCITEEGIIKKR
jgi:uncharacterized protein YbbK (DUF523 family)